MAWMPGTRKDYARDCNGYASDMIDAEWKKIIPHLPPCAEPGYTPTRTTCFHSMVNAVFYCCNQIASGTCSPRIFHCNKRFTVTFGTSGNGTWKHIYDGLYLAVHDRG